LARSCSLAGLLREFLIVDEEQRAELFIGNRQVEVPYLDYLATRFKGFSSVTTATIAIGAIADEASRQRRSEFVHDLKQRCSDKDIHFRDGTISVPLAAGELSSSFIEPTWAFNLVAVPEDWTGESQKIGIPLKMEAAEDVAFNIAATVTGLWVWSDVPPLSEGVLREHIEQPPLRLIRATARVVPLGNLTDVIAYAAMDPENSWPTPEGCESHPHSEHFVRSTLNSLVETSVAGLMLADEPKSPPPSKSRVGILDAIVLYFSHLVANLLGQPAKAWLRAKEKAISWTENYIQRKTFQDDSRLLVRFGGRLRDGDFVGEGSSRASEIGDLEGLEVPPVRATPDRWRLIARVVLGAIDGQRTQAEDLEFNAPAFRGAQAVAKSRQVIGPNPFDVAGQSYVGQLEVNGEHRELVIRSFDAIRYREILEELQRDSESPAEGEKVGDTQNADQDSTIRFSESERGTVVSNLTQWHEQRSESLLWSISKHLDGQIQEAAARLRESLHLIETLPTQIAVADANQRKKVRRGKWLARLLLLLTLVAVVFPFVPPVAAAGLLAGGALATALFFLPYLALLGFLGAWLANARAQVREEFKLKDLESLESLARKKRHHYWSEIHRLEYCYAHFLDWAEILAWVVWKPFGVIEVPKEPEVRTPSVNALSFQFATPRFKGDAVLAEQISMRSHVAGRGWLNTIFSELKQIVVANYAKLASVEGLDADPFFDTSLSHEYVQVGERRLYKPRFQFLLDVTSGRPQQSVAEAKFKEVREVVASRDLTHLVDHVEAHAFVKIDSDVDRREISEYLSPILEIRELPVFERYVETSKPNASVNVGSVYWAAAGIKPDVVFEGSELELHGAVGSGMESGALAASRLDVSIERFWPSELTFVRTSKAQTPTDGELQIPKVPVGPKKKIID
jgi:hypothetical protein